MRALVLAAGQGTRLRPLTDDRPKCLVPLLGRPLLEWQVDALRAAGIADITVVTGYRAEQIEAMGLATVHNPRYASTNMVASLMAASAILRDGEDLVIAYGDLVYEPAVVRALVGAPHDLAITIDLEWRRLWALRMSDPLDDAESLRLDASGSVRELGRRPLDLSEIEGQFMGLILLRAPAAGHVIDVYDSLDPHGEYEGSDRDNMFMTGFLQYLIDHGTTVASVPVARGWLEVDSVEDLERYEALDAAGELAAQWSPGGRG